LEYEREAFFVTVHELGHVFNLWHESTTSNFLLSPHPTNPTDQGAFQFLPAHRVFLSHVESAPEVYPGGNDFGCRGVLGPPGDEESRHLEAKPTRLPLELLIEASQYELAFFEPIELDITLRAVGSNARTVRIPSRIDPGYAEFVVWIESPDGARRRYRSPRRYCGGTTTLAIAPKRPFRRDLSVFLESGGFTFRSLGEHRVFATCLLPSGTVARSNTVTLSVRGRYGSSLFADEVQGALTQRQMARFLYHRRGPFHHRWVDCTEELARRSRDPMLKANLHYALGRYFASTSERASSAARARRLRQKALGSLSRALERSELSAERRCNAESCADELRG
jgi:hypothetical protein